MTKKERRELIEYAEAISAMFGANLKITKEKEDTGGCWPTAQNKIYVSGAFANKARFVSVFCHELAHYINWIEGRYPLYHNKDIFGIAKHFHSFNHMVDYCHRAEVFTEYRGRELAKLFFPNTTYLAFYRKNSNYSKGFMSGYYLLNVQKHMEGV